MASAEQAQVLKKAAEPTPQELERSITSSVRSWASNGSCFRKLKRGGHYCERFPSWDDYVRALWGWSGRHADRMITAASKVAPNIRQIDHALSLQAAMKLVRVPKGLQAAVVCEAIATARSCSPSADEVAKAAAKHLESNRRRRRGGKKPKPDEHKLPLGTITIFAGKKIVIVAKKAGEGLDELLVAARVKLSAAPQADAAWNEINPESRFR